MTLVRWYSVLPKVSTRHTQFSARPQTYRKDTMLALHTYLRVVKQFIFTLHVRSLGRAPRHHQTKLFIIPDYIQWVHMYNSGKVLAVVYMFETKCIAIFKIRSYQNIENMKSNIKILI